MKKLALVTGGGRGLGAEICRELAEAGYEAIGVDLKPPRGGLQLDITREDDVVKAFSRLERLDVLVNNAGVDYTLPIEELSLNQWDHVMAVNLRAPFVLAKHAARLMQRQGGGHIINIASTAAKRTWPNASAYHASKWGLLGLSHALHAELRPQKIKVSAVIAGGMRTPFLLERFPDIDPGVLQDPANVAKTVRFLLTLPDETVIPEVMVIPMREGSWP
ncbi:MAG: SDR family oxidoreductase [Betaproteobacteria bacterium]|nr:SDR family oxidoreductase [Betaproteobacteria bacterium]